MVLPNALFVGPQKTGTTWILEYLKRRGDVGLPFQTKEMYFFDQNYHRGLSWYSRHFGDVAKASRIVEVAPSYLDSPELAQRVFRDLGQIPVVVTFRDPVSRTYSHYLQALRYGWTRLPFILAIEKLPILARPSQYETHLKRWFDVFGRDHNSGLVSRRNSAEYGIVRIKNLSASEIRLIFPGFNFEK